MAGDFNKPATSDAYTAFASSVRDIAADLAKGLDPVNVSTTNIPTNAIRWTSASNKWQKWNGSTWADLSSLYAINISGNAATATNATNASAVAWSGVSGKPTTIGGFGITDLVASILSSFRKDNWSTNGIVAAVSGLLAWKNFGNNHVIFDASAGTAPDGSAVNNTTASGVWQATYPTLMGWNGSTTYGVRVDAARWADGATNANTAAACSGNAATATYATSAGSATTATTAGACSGNAATATSASSLTGGGAGYLPWQSAAGVTAMLGAGVSGYVLTSGGGGAPGWLPQTSINAGLLGGVAASGFATASHSHADVPKDLGAGNFPVGIIVLGDVVSTVNAGATLAGSLVTVLGGGMAGTWRNVGATVYGSAEFPVSSYFQRIA